MSKFLELAENIEADLREFDEEADVLDMKRRRNKERAHVIFSDHNDVQDRVKAGMDRMEAVMHDMGGSNSRKAKTSETTASTEETAKLGEASGGMSEASFPNQAG